MKDLTDRQSTILEFIKKHIADAGFPPTLREIGDEVGISSTNAVTDHLIALSNKGYTELTPTVSRGIRVLPRSVEIRKVHVVPSPDADDLPAEVTIDLVFQGKPLSIKMAPAVSADNLEPLFRALTDRLAASRLKREKATCPPTVGNQ